MSADARIPHPKSNKEYSLAGESNSRLPAQACHPHDSAQSFATQVSCMQFLQDGFWVGSARIPEHFLISEMH